MRSFFGRNKALNDVYQYIALEMLQRSWCGKPRRLNKVYSAKSTSWFPEAWKWRRRVLVSLIGRDGNRHELFVHGFSYNAVRPMMASFEWRHRQLQHHRQQLIRRLLLMIWKCRIIQDVYGLSCHQWHVVSRIWGCQDLGKRDKRGDNLELWFDNSIVQLEATIFWGT